MYTSLAKKRGGKWRKEEREGKGDGGKRRGREKEMRKEEREKESSRFFQGGDSSILKTSVLCISSGGSFQNDFRLVASKKNCFLSLVNTIDHGVPATGTLSIGCGPFLSSILRGGILRGRETAGGGGGGPVPNLAATSASSSFSPVSMGSTSGLLISGLLGNKGGVGRMWLRGSRGGAGGRGLGCSSKSTG